MKEIKYTEIKGRIEQAQKECNIKNKDIETILNINKDALGNFKKGKIPKGETLFYIAQLLNISVEYLLTGEEPTPNSDADGELLLKNYNKLNDAAKKELDNYLEFLLQKNENLNTETRSLISKIG